MSLAPKLDELKKKQEELSSHQSTISSGEQSIMDQSAEVNNQNITTSHLDLSYGFEKVAVIGTGGAGKVCTMRYAKVADPESIRVITIDTSGVPSDIKNIEAIKIKDLNGAGKLRRNCIEPISDFIADYVTKSHFELVNVIVASFSGGSGSVICPLLVDEILRQDKIAIVIGIIDTDSEVDTINALNCLKTFDNIASNRKGYLPMILFNNSNGRGVVDNGIDIMLNNIYSLLNIPYIGLDIQDRIRFLNPQAFDGVTTGGIRLLNITKQPKGDWETELGLVIPEEPEKIDAMMLITHLSENLKPSKRCSVIFRGHYEASGENMVAAIGYQIPEQFIKDLNADIHAFKSTNTKKATAIECEYQIGETDKRGIVL